MKKRYYVIFRGQVQGVGFRWTIQQLAKRYGCTGWIRNLYSGNVDMEIQGPALDIHAFVMDINNSSRWIRVDDYFSASTTLIRLMSLSMIHILLLWSQRYSFFLKYDVGNHYN